ncbi:MAG: hypothetical protein SFZ24_03705, partial [Planctomycetota bacterium]|nr:hypothetical protein [Planctomycetota bacterium]
LTLGHLRGARARAQETGSLSNMQQHVYAFASYNTDFDEFMPCFIDPHVPRVFKFPEAQITVYYMDCVSWWNLALWDRYSTLDPFADHFTAPAELEADHALLPWMRDWPRLFASYYYSRTFLADPEYWTLDGRRGRSQYRAVRTTEVVYPSAKGFLLERWSYNQGHTMVPLAFVDGSVRREQREALHPGLPDGAGDPDIGPTEHRNVPSLHTINGVRGRDLR